MNEYAKAALEILVPILTTLATIILPVLALRINTLIGAKTEAEQTANEKLIRDALHASASNALAFALQKLGMKYTDLSPGVVGSATTTDSVLKLAADYVKDKNPDNLTKLNVTDAQLRDILLTKLPTLK